MRNISSWSIVNPVPALVAFAMLTLAGIVSFVTMDINDMPEIDFPVASVVVNQPGAAPTEMETQVTQRVEAAVRSLNGVDEITSVRPSTAASTMCAMPFPTFVVTCRRASCNRRCRVSISAAMARWLIIRSKLST